MKLSFRKAILGFTLVEMMMSLACGSMVLAVTVIAGVALQKSFAATETYSTSEGDQLRILDYVAMDIRRASQATVSGNSLTVTVPDYYTATDTSAAPTNPTLSAQTISYSAGTTTITYALSGTSFQRTVQTNGGTAVTTNIATNVSSFNISSSALTSSISCSIMFFPTYLRNAGNGTWRSGGSAPVNGTGANGDWYVIDATASSSSTIGNVYYQSGGVYTLVDNAKATLVYCNTFFRNASARQ